ncbi:uncharacterized protein TNCV_3989701 [Trichonephila clavipes]|uniref:Uncharacterized protein n=1 Tax=Trichonephila clavipes TaxID=2585209 RepID=A0A8X6SZA9_TRICX|nr:uncharacterized protein TNCV_3989701 [Trichonephila clavipes]
MMKNKFLVVAPVLRSQFYMDDALCGAETLEEAKVQQHQLIAILKSAGMELHKICGNHSELSQCLNEIYNFSTPNETKTLGVSWGPVKDTFSFKVDVKPSYLYTKRSVLTTSARLFDPLRLVGPMVSKPRCLCKSFGDLILTGKIHSQIKCILNGTSSELE